MIWRLSVILLFAISAWGQTAPQAPQTFEEISSKARQAYESDRPAEAAELFARAVKLRPDWTQGWWALGMIEYQRDKYAECRDALTEMVKLDPSAPAGFALLGLCEFRTKQYDASFQHLKKAHTMVRVTQAGGPLLDIADYHLSLLLTEQGAFEVSQELLMSVARRVHNNPEMEVAAGLPALRLPILPAEISATQRDVVTLAGKAFWDLATKSPEEADADFKALVSKYPKTPNVHYFYGTYLAARYPEQCAEEFLQELKITPDSVPARVQLSLRYQLEEKLDDALRFAREAVALSPDSVGAQLALAKVLRAQGDNEGALAAFLVAERLDPVSPSIRLYIVNAYRALDRIDDMRRENAEYERLKAEQGSWP